METSKYPRSLEEDRKHLFKGAKKILGRKTWEDEVDDPVQGIPPFIFRSLKTLRKLSFPSRQ